ncbi:outer membrane beta-barrel protein [Pedobacter caeni]|uniref:Outer membrane protein beta-barrel domain-containing protein n=1 Tax=Pedobacter caeni TaxID=288992 RepID=A0A1M5H1N8_9SPHI|nr:outer membrane beta-barrel protein [Pedobacter caeni]SHG09887.1 Outer membrane protein beta-barrel domain-containing protein [Pedobacter caeni]
MNKKLIIAAALCGLALGSRAQTEKGSFLLGGDFNFHSKRDKDDAPRTNSFGLGPKFGYFISDNFAIGLGASYFYSNQESWTTDDQGPEGPIRKFNNGFRQSGFNIAPFVRHYIDLNAKFKFFSNLSVSAGKSWGRSLGEPTTNNYLSKFELKYYGATLSPGFVFFPTKKIAIELSTTLISYHRSEDTFKYDPNNVNTLYVPQIRHMFQFGLSTIQPAIGVNYHF